VVLKRKKCIGIYFSINGQEIVLVEGRESFILTIGTMDWNEGPKLPFNIFQEGATSVQLSSSTFAIFAGTLQPVSSLQN